MNGQRIGFTLGVAAVVCLQVFAHAQEPTARTPRKGDAVIARGCLAGPTLESIETTLPDDTGRLSTPITYQLKGDKSLLKRMRDEHDGKQVEVSGTLKSALPQDSAMGGKTMGRTKVVFGIATPTAPKGTPDPQSGLPVLEVKSYNGIDARCGR